MCYLCKVSWLYVHTFLQLLSQGTEQNVRKESKIWFRRFVNPVQITVASSFPARHTCLWKSSSEAIAPRWRILDVITSICRLFYSHCEVTCPLPLTSPHNGQLPSTHQSLSEEFFDTRNLVEIISFDNLGISVNLLIHRFTILSALRVTDPISATLGYVSKLSSTLNATLESSWLKK